MACKTNYLLGIIHIIKINKIIMNQPQEGFFQTQIAQKGEEQPQESKPEEVAPVSPVKSQEKLEEDQLSLRQLLAAFNKFDKEEKGLISVENIADILSSKNIPTQNVKDYHRMSLPIFDNLASFDQFLFVFCLSENTSERVEQKYALCKKVDERLIDFLKLLNKYRKKSEKGGNYKEAKDSKTKIQQIRDRELDRRNKYLKILYETEMIETENMQKQKFAQFCAKWDQFMNEYELTASDITKKVKEKQIIQAVEFQARVREELAPKLHYSKYMLELQTKQRNLVKIQEYEKAREIQAQIEDLKIKQRRQKQIADEEVVELRLKALKKQQESTISTLLQKIQKDRNEHMRQRQSQTQKLMVRNKSQLTQIDHRFNETIKKIYEALHNLGLDSDKNIRKQ